MTKIFKLNKNLFKVGDNYICISYDKIDLNDWFVFTWCREHTIQKCTEDKVAEIDHRCKKIIFSTQFIHESIPVLNIEDGESIKPPYQQELDEYGDEIWDDGKLYWAQKGFKEGYQKAKETFKYTEEDLRKAFWAGSSYQDDLYRPWDNTPKNVDEYIHSLQQPKEIKSIEIEYKDWCDYDDDNTLGGLDKSDYRPVTLLNGKVKCKINY